MGQTERLYKIKSQLDAGRCLTKGALLAELEVSAATLKRDLALLRDRMNAPIVFDRERGGWRLDAAAQLPGTQYELPGLWLAADEIHALLAMQQLLTHLDAGGLLAPHIAPLEDRLRRMLGSGSPRTSPSSSTSSRAPASRVSSSTSATTAAAISPRPSTSPAFSFRRGPWSR